MGLRLAGEAARRQRPRAGGAERVAREELGLDPGSDVILAAAQVAEVQAHGISRTEDAPAYGAITDYVHALFDAQVLHHDQLRSMQPLVWATAEEIHGGWTAATDPAGRTPPARAGKISLTTAHLLETLGAIEEQLSPEEEEDVRRWIAESGEGARDGRRTMRRWSPPSRSSAATSKAGRSGWPSGTPGGAPIMSWAGTASLASRSEHASCERSARSCTCARGSIISSLPSRRSPWNSRRFPRGTGSDALYHGALHRRPRSGGVLERGG